MGVIVIKNLDRNGEVVGAVLADDNSDYMLITNQGQLIRSSMSDTPLVSRSAAGNILMRMNEGDAVQALQSIPEDVVKSSKEVAEARQKEKEELAALEAAQKAKDAEAEAIKANAAPQSGESVETVENTTENTDNQ